MQVLSCGSKASNISGISDAISPRYICKYPRSMYARVPQGMAQFVLKIEKCNRSEYMSLETDISYFPSRLDFFGEEKVILLTGRVSTGTEKQKQIHSRF